MPTWTKPSKRSCGVPTRHPYSFLLHLTGWEIKESPSLPRSFRRVSYRNIDSIPLCFELLNSLPASPSQTLNLLPACPSLPRKKMECVGLRCGNSVGKPFLSSHNVGADQLQRQSQRISCSCRPQLPQTMLKANSQQINTTGNALKLPPVPPIVFCDEETSGTGKEEISTETLDEWMSDSVSEIVKKIGEAPFLVHLFSSKMNGKTKVTRLNKEQATAEEWPIIKRRWEEREGRGECSTPDGIILVEELEDEENGEDDGGRREDDESSTRAWGIVIQGRGLKCNPACYILKTCRVGSPLIGYCTHFCLLKAQFYGETALQQLKNSWLLHPQLVDQHSYFF